MAETFDRKKSLKILVINPNTTQSMTEGLIRPIVRSVLSLHSPGYIEVDFFTAPSPAPGSASETGAIPSINSSDDAYRSALYCLPHLEPLIASDQYDGYLVACYSDHPLVEMIATVQGRRRKHVIGIFEASIMTSLGIGKFGIVTTGEIWKEELSHGVERFLGITDSKGSSTKFAGVATTGLTAKELHDLEATMVRDRIRSAAEQLARDHEDVKAICIGCAGMAGFETAIREGVRNVLGEAGGGVYIVEGVSAGTQWLISVCRLQ